MGRKAAALLLLLALGSASTSFARPSDFDSVLVHRSLLQTPTASPTPVPSPPTPSPPTYGSPTPSPSSAPVVYDYSLTLSVTNNGTEGSSATVLNVGVNVAEGLFWDDVIFPITVSIDWDYHKAWSLGQPANYSNSDPIIVSNASAIATLLPATITHQYVRGGPQTVSMKAVDGNGTMLSAATAEFYVTPAAITVSAMIAQAGAQAVTATRLVVNVTIPYNDTSDYPVTMWVDWLSNSTIAPFVPIANYTLTNFGGSQFDVMWQYQKPGSYIVRIRVADADSVGSPVEVTLPVFKVANTAPVITSCMLAPGMPYPVNTPATTSTLMSTMPHPAYLQVNVTNPANENFTVFAAEFEAGKRTAIDMSNGMAWYTYGTPGVKPVTVFIDDGQGGASNFTCTNFTVAKRECFDCSMCVAQVSQIVVGLSPSNNAAALSSAFLTACSANANITNLFGSSKCSQVANLIAQSFNGNLAKRPASLCNAFGACKDTTCGVQFPPMNSPVPLSLCSSTGLSTGADLLNATDKNPSNSCGSSADCTGGQVCDLSAALPACQCDPNTGLDMCAKLGSCAHFCDTPAAVMALASTNITTCTGTSDTTTCATGYSCQNTTDYATIILGNAAFAAAMIKGSCPSGSSNFTTEHVQFACFPSAGNAPTIVSASLNAAATTLSIGLTAPALAGEYRCGDVITVTSSGTEMMSLLGATPRCSVAATDPQTLVVALSGDATIVAAATTKVNIRANQAALVHATYKTWKFVANTTASFEVTGPASYTDATARLFSAASQLPLSATDACNRAIPNAAGLRVVVSAETSSHPSGRPFMTHWDVFYGSDGTASNLTNIANITGDANFANITSALTAINADTTLANRRFVLDYNSVLVGLPAGLYRFQAVVYTALSTFAAANATATAKTTLDLVKPASAPVSVVRDPAIRIVGAEPDPITGVYTFSGIAPSAGLRVSTFIDSFANFCPSDTIVYQWTSAATGPYLALPQDFLPAHTKDFIASGFSGIDTTQPYILTLNAYIRDSNGGNAGTGKIFTIHINFQSPPISASLTASYAGDMPVATDGITAQKPDLILDASKYFDPEDKMRLNTPTVSWQCIHQLDPKPCFGGNVSVGTQDANTMKWTIPLNAFVANVGFTHTFRVTLTKPGGRTATASVTVNPRGFTGATVIPYGTLRRTCPGNTDCKSDFHDPSKPLVLTLTRSSDAASVSWSYVGLSGSDAASESAKRTVIPPSRLKGASMVMATATLSLNGQTSSVMTTVPIAIQPECSAASCLNVDAVSTVYLTNIFQLTATNWVTGGRPATYEFGRRVPGSTSPIRMLSDSPSNTFTAQGLPSGQHSFYVCVTITLTPDLKPRTCYDLATVYTVAAATTTVNATDAINSLPKASDLAKSGDLSYLINAGGNALLSVAGATAGTTDADQKAAVKTAVTDMLTAVGTLVSEDNPSSSKDALGFMSNIMDSAGDSLDLTTVTGTLLTAAAKNLDMLVKSESSLDEDDAEAATKLLSEIANKASSGAAEASRRRLLVAIDYAAVYSSLASQMDNVLTLLQAQSTPGSTALLAGTFDLSIQGAVAVSTPTSLDGFSVAVAGTGGVVMPSGYSADCGAGGATCPDSIITKVLYYEDASLLTNIEGLSSVIDSSLSPRAYEFITVGVSTVTGTGSEMPVTGELCSTAGACPLRVRFSVGTAFSMADGTTTICLAYDPSAKTYSGYPSGTMAASSVGSGLVECSVSTPGTYVLVQYGTATAGSTPAPDVVRRVTITFNADYDKVSADAALFGQMQADVLSAISRGTGVPVPNIAARFYKGSIKVDATITYTGVMADAAADAATAAFVSGIDALFSSEFKAKYGVTGSVSAKTVTAFSQDAPAPADAKKGDSNKAWIAAPVICGIAAVIGIAVLVVFLKKRRDSQRTGPASSAHAPAHDAEAGHSHVAPAPVPPAPAASSSAGAGPSHDAKVSPLPAGEV